MSIPYQHVRPIGDKTKYVAKGKTDFTGQFDKEKYEVILGKPPKDAVSVDPELPKSLKEQLEEAFFSILPKHIDKPYYTDKVDKEIWTVKQTIDDLLGNLEKIGQQVVLKTAVKHIEAINLPAEMESDKQALLSLINGK